MTLSMDQVPVLGGRPPLPLQDLDRDQVEAERLERVLRNYNARAVSRRGGILPAYATQTGDVLLPSPVRYDPMGYAYALSPEPAYATLGQATETPELRALPWEIGQEPSAETLRKRRSEERWQKASTLIGVIGGALGILLSYRALRGRG